jgi:thioredoxin reductase (NADPH)
MNYKRVATTVFTPLELGTVGLTEAEAVEQFGAKHVDAYLSLFTPLEWTIVEDHSVTCYAKIVIDRVTTEVLGIHIAAPNAGEIIQGFAVAFRKGMKYADLSDTVGIHPTTAEELCGMTVTRSSGEKVEKSAC